MWNTLSDVYVCGSMWTHVVWYVLYMYYRYKKVKKCFTDQNMLNTVNTKSSHSILTFNQPSLRLLLITQDNETGDELRHSQIVIFASNNTSDTQPQFGSGG